MKLKTFILSKAQKRTDGWFQCQVSRTDSCFRLFVTFRPLFIFLVSQTLQISIHVFEISVENGIWVENSIWFDHLDHHSRQIWAFTQWKGFYRRRNIYINFYEKHKKSDNAGTFPLFECLKIVSSSGISGLMLCNTSYKWVTLVEKTTTMNTS